MVEEITINEKTYIKIETSEWRYSAMALGLMNYFDYLDIAIIDKEVTTFNILDFSDELENNAYIIYDKSDGYEYFCFSKSFITEKNYLDFISEFYAKDFHHLQIKEYFIKSIFSDEEVKEINLLLKKNEIMKKVFKDILFDGTNKDKILKIMNENSNLLIKETYRGKQNLYANYANKNRLLSDKHNDCRLAGYWIDTVRKERSTAYQFNKNTVTGMDTILFDWIPFAFIGDYEAFFINQNYSLCELKKTYTFLKTQVNIDTDENKNKRQNVRYSLFNTIIQSSQLINNDIEVIYKNQSNDFFETLYIRKDSIKILKSMAKLDYKAFCRPFKINDKDYIDIQKKVIHCVLNLILTDELIELSLKQKNDNGYLVSQLIIINQLIRKGGETMKKKMSCAYACAKEVVAKIPENKTNSYRQRLTSAIVFKDYDRVCQVLLQLSNYSNVSFNFAYDLYEDFDNNKDIAYTFINALRIGNNENTKGKKDEE
jgi:CRISPR-associated protein Cst1